MMGGSGRRDTGSGGTGGGHGVAAGTSGSSNLTMLGQGRGWNKGTGRTSGRNWARPMDGDSTMPCGGGTKAGVHSSHVREVATHTTAGVGMDPPPGETKTSSSGRYGSWESITIPETYGRPGRAGNCSSCCKAAGDGIGGELQACATTGITVGPPRVQQKALSLSIGGGSSGTGSG